MRSAIALFVSIAAACQHRTDPPPPSTPPPPDGVVVAEPRVDLPVPATWLLQSSEKIVEPDEVVASAAFTPAGWHRAPVPGTVVGALVADGTYPDPYVGTNLRSLPGGTDYPIGTEFYRRPMSPANPHRVSWWYRTELDVPALASDRRLWLRLDGLNYRASVWLNGQRLADERQIVGAYRSFTFDVTPVVAGAARSVLAVEVSPSQVSDLGINWVDWAPFPPDKNLGLWRPVALYTTGPVTLDAPHVITDLDLPALDRARLTVTTDVRNATDQPVRVRLDGRIEGPASATFTDEVELAAGETRTVRFEPGKHPALSIAQPALWWPFDLGEPDLHRVTVRAVVDGEPSDLATARFGIREVSSELTERGHRLFRVNGRPILIRGAGWTPELLLRPEPQRVADQMAYVRDMGLNTIRIEGKLGDEQVLDLADELGILVMAGWCCCDLWERDEEWDDEDRAVARGSLEDQARMLRRHPSTLMWLNGSDSIREPATERMYVDVLGQLDWPAPIVAAAVSGESEVTGPTGVKMRGPYGWVPPNYWALDTGRGGAFGFATEVSMGAAIPPVESLTRMLGADHLWPIDATWRFHAGGSEATQDLGPYLAAIDARYGRPTGVDDFAHKSQLAAYEGVRAMFEAFGRSKYTATGVIQWMLNDPWPGLLWHLYDWYLKPGGGYFGAKKALEPLHVQFGYDDRAVVVVNSTPRAQRGLAVRAEVLDLGGRTRWRSDATVDVADDGVARAMTVPASVDGTGQTYLLRLSLSSGGAPVSDNLYWLSRKADVLDWDRATWFYTPQREHGDLTGLASLAPATVTATATRKAVAGAAREEEVTVELAHASGPLAFFVRAEVTRWDGGEVLPVRWTDNYVTLLPGERRRLVARFRAADAGDTISLRVGGGNVVVTTHAVTAAP